MKQIKNNTTQLLKSTLRGDFEGLRAYTTPIIEVIKLDNEISLVLQSAEPPIGPGELVQGQLYNDPFKTTVG